jgi:L-alanine-DL-glutamate epimerase-like enolase superfamily enzyme
MQIDGNWSAMVHAVRNLGRPGICSMGIAAVDAALWDLKASILGVPLVDLLGAARDRIEVYGSGGFTSYDRARLQERLGKWAAGVYESENEDSARTRSGCCQSQGRAPGNRTADRSLHGCEWAY